MDMFLGIIYGFLGTILSIAVVIMFIETSTTANDKFIILYKYWYDLKNIKDIKKGFFEELKDSIEDFNIPLWKKTEAVRNAENENKKECINFCKEMCLDLAKRKRSLQRKYNVEIELLNENSEVADRLREEGYEVKTFNLKNMKNAVPFNTSDVEVVE